MIRLYITTSRYKQIISTRTRISTDSNNKLAVICHVLWRQAIQHIVAVSLNSVLAANEVIIIIIMIILIMVAANAVATRRAKCAYDVHYQ